MKKLNKYKKGELSVEELEEFTDQFMRAKHDQDRKNRWSQKLLTQHQVSRDLPENQNIPLKSRKLYIIVMAAAAAIALLFFAAPWATNSTALSSDQLAAAYLNENFFENQSITKSDQDIEELNLQAILAYNQRDFPTAIGNFETLISQGNATDEQYLFLGLSYLYSGQSESAASLLRQTLRLFPDSRFMQETNWFLALAHLKNQNKQAAQTILRNLTANDWNYTKAQALLAAME